MAKKEIHKDTKHEKKEVKEPENNESINKSKLLPILIIVGLVLVCGLIIMLTKDNSVQEPEVFVQPVVEENVDKMEVTPEPVIEEVEVIKGFEFTLLESDLLKEINKKRIQYGFNPFQINFQLSEVQRAHTDEMLNSGRTDGIDSTGSAKQRATSVDVADEILEVNQKFTVPADQAPVIYIFEELNTNNLFRERYQNIGLAISEGENNEYYLSYILY